LLYRPAVFADFPGLSAGQSTRHGGVSRAPYATLNLGKSTGDDLAAIVENRLRFCAALDFRPEHMAWSIQMHGDQVRHVSAPGGTEGFDALVTDRPGILLTVSVADCTPILIFDKKHRAIAAIHAGWRGTALHIVGKTLRQMEHLFETRAEDCFAYLGACIDECSFEVGEEIAAAFDDTFKRFDPARQKFFVDLKQANAAQLRAFSVPDEQIEISPFSTVLHNDDYFSHRLEKGITGRMLAAIGIKSDP